MGIGSTVDASPVFCLSKGIEKRYECGIVLSMTALEKQILDLPKLQKISMMEKLWADLSKEEDRFEVPEWHARELEKTEQRLAEGKEQFEDWTEAKRKLRNS